MALNEVFRDADHLSLPVPVGTVTGGAVRIGGLNGVAQTNRADSTVVDDYRGPAVNLNKDGYATVWLKGAFELTVTTTTTLAVGAPVYIILASNVLTTTDNTGANPVFGHALTAKGNTASVVTVRLTN